MMVESSALDIVITKLYLYECGKYHDQYRRGLATHLDADVLNTFNSATHNGQHISNKSMAKVVGQILVPNSSVEKKVGIEYGWQQKRYRFVMELTITNRFGAFRQRKIITGWTDHNEGIITNSSLHPGNVLLSPNMRFYINNEITLRDTIIPGGINGHAVYNTTPIYADHYLTGYYEYNAGNYNVNEMSVRPEDIVASLAAGSQIMSMAGGQFVDTSSLFVGNAIKLSARVNESPVYYLTRILKNFAEAREAAQQIGLDEFSSIENTMMETSTLVGERLPQDNLWLRQLRQVSDFIRDGFFTYGQLCEIFSEPAIDAVTKIMQYQITPGTVILPADTSNSNEFYNSDGASVTMSKVMNSLPSIMMDSLLESVGYIYSNNNAGCQGTLTPIRAEFFRSLVGDNSNMRQYNQNFITRFLTEIEPSLTYNGQVSLEMRIIANIFGDTTITINYNGTGECQFQVPTFCDTLLSPMVTSSKDTKDRLTSGINNIFNELTGGSMVNANMAGSNGSWPSNGWPVTNMPSTLSQSLSDVTPTICSGQFDESKVDEQVPTLF